MGLEGAKKENEVERMSATGYEKGGRLEVWKTGKDMRLF
jgi:hypothetical protein